MSVVHLSVYSSFHCNVTQSAALMINSVIAMYCSVGVIWMVTL